MKHYLITRFNINLYGSNPYKIKHKTDWMKQRIIEFEKWTAPSVLNQTETNFTWCIVFDPKTPICFIHQVKKIVENKNIAVWVSTSYDVTSIAKHLDTSLDFVITSRVDNDDILHTDYIKEIHKAFDNKTEIIDVDGEQWDTLTNKFYTSGRSQNNSPFLSLVENTKRDIRTCFEHDHTYMPFYYESKKIDKVLYTQVLHDNNIANKIKGVEK